MDDTVHRYDDASREALRSILDAGGHLVRYRSVPLGDKGRKMPVDRGWLKRPLTREVMDGHLEKGGYVGLVPSSLGLVVFDVDAGGQDGVDAISEAVGPPALVVPSGTKGRFHVWYRSATGDERNREYEIGPATGEVRGAKGAVILYRPVELASVLGSVDGLEAVDCRTVGRRSTKTTAPTSVRWAPGNRNRTLFSEACRLLRDGDLPGLDALRETASRSGLDEAEIEATVVNAKRAVNDEAARTKPLNRDGLREMLDALAIELRRDVRSSGRLQVRGGRTGPRWREWTDDDDYDLRETVSETWVHLNTRGQIRPWDVGLERLVHMVRSVSPEVDPFIEWLESLPPWDGVERLWYWLPETMEGPDARKGPGTVAGWVSHVIPLAAVARAYEPGCKFDTMPVLIGPQGAGKSTAVMELLPDSGWFTESLDLSSRSRDRVEAMDGAVIVESSELSGMRNQDLENLKSFLSQRSFRGRMAYGRHTRTVPRRCVIVGTSNNVRALPNDPTGNRRFIPVLFGEGPGSTEVRKRVEVVREQVWAEALTVYREGGERLLDVPDDVRDELEAAQSTATDRDDIMEDAVSTYQVTNWEWGDHLSTVKAQIHGDVFGDTQAMRDVRIDHRLRRALVKAGWVQRVVRPPNSQSTSRRWFPPNHRWATTVEDG